MHTYLNIQDPALPDPIAALSSSRNKLDSQRYSPQSDDWKKTLHGIEEPREDSAVFEES